MTARFEAFPDPMNRWVVWDCQNDTFARIGGDEAIGLGETHATSICDALNRAFDTYAPLQPGADGELPHWLPANVIVKLAPNLPAFG